MTLPAALLFDLDDTILHGEAVGDECWLASSRNSAFALNIPHPALFEELQLARHWYWSCEVRHHSGRLRLVESRAEIAAIALEKLGLSKSEAKAEGTKIALEFQALYYELLRPFPFAMETLNWFHEKNIPMGLITNGSSEGQRKKIAKFQLEKLFSVIVVEEEFGVGKPDTKVFAFALDKLKTKAQETWMVGDRLDWDVGAPQKLGIHGIWNDFRRRGLPLQSEVTPDRIVHSIAELAGLS